MITAPVATAESGLERARLWASAVPEWVGALIPALIALVLGIIGIGDKSLWLDEAFSVMIARLPTADLLAYLVREELHASPYYLSLHVWTVLGESEAVARLLSVVFGVVAVLATFAVGRRYGVGAAAALVLAVSPTFVQFEQQVRPYTMLAAWAALSTLAFLRLADRWTRSRAAVYLGLAAAIIYVHPIGAFVIAAHGLATLFLLKIETRRRTLALLVAVGLAWLPMLLFMVRNRDKINWIEPLSAGSLSEQLVALGGGPVVAGAVLVLIALGIRRDLPALWLLVPIGGTILLSILVQPTLQSRYLIGTLPAMAIIVARNRPAALAVLVALSLAANYLWYTSGPEDDWRAGVAYVQQNVEPGDGVIFTPPFARPAFEYYGEVGEPLFPAIPWDGRYLPGIGQPTLPDAEIDNRRIWLIASHGEGTAPAVQEVIDRYVATEHAEFGPNGPRVSLLELRR